MLHCGNALSPRAALGMLVSRFVPLYIPEAHSCRGVATNGNSSEAHSWHGIAANKSLGCYRCWMPAFSLNEPFDTFTSTVQDEPWECWPALLTAKAAGRSTFSTTGVVWCTSLGAGLWNPHVLLHGIKSAKFETFSYAMSGKNSEIQGAWFLISHNHIKSWALILEKQQDKLIMHHSQLLVEI